MRIDQKVDLVLWIRIPQTGDSPDCILCPGGKILPSALIIQISFYDSRKFQFTFPAFLIPLYIFLHNDLIGKCLIRTLQYHASEIASRVEIFCCDKIFQPVRITDKFFCGNMRVLHIEEIPLCSHIDLKISPCILLDRKGFLARFRKRHESPALFLQRQKDFFLLFASHKELFQSVLIQLPFAHIVIKGLDPDIFIF